jgi:hypothetical protein
VDLPRAFRIGLAALAGLLACGLPLWPLAYEQVSLPGNPSGWLWLAGAAASGALGAHLVRGGLLAPVAAVVAGFVLAVMLRVSVETSADPTSHNLWPFEVAIAGGIGAAGALAGAGIARLVQRATGAQRPT